MKKGYVSIIIPLYNGEKYIKNTIETIQRSRYRLLEIIIVDDGSKDQGVDICRKLQAQDSRIVIYSKENGGVASARNFGVERSEGEFLCFCDQDDIVECTMYERLVEVVSQNDCDFGMCGTGRYIDGEKSGYESFPDRTYSEEEILSQLLYPLLFNGYKIPVEMCGDKRYPAIWKCLFRKEFWEKQSFQFRIYINYEDDLLLLIEALTKAQKVVTITDRGYYWRVNLKSETYAGKFVEAMADKQKQCLQDILENMHARGISEEVIVMYQMVAWCRFYVDSIHNLTSPQISKNRAFVVNYIRDNIIYREDFAKNIKARCWIKKGHVKPKVLLFFLNKRMSYTCYLAERVLDWLLLVVLKSPTLIKLERWIKRGK